MEMLTFLGVWFVASLVVGIAIGLALRRLDRINASSLEQTMSAGTHTDPKGDASVAA